MPANQTPTPAAQIASQAVITAAATLPPAAAEAAGPTAASPTPLEPGNLLSRLGVGVPLGVTDFDFDAEMAQRFGMGWYLDWHINPAPIDVEGLEYAQLYAMRDSNIPLRRADYRRGAGSQPRRAVAGRQRARCHLAGQQDA